MPKGRNAFALKNFEIIFLNHYEYGTDFREYFKQWDVLGYIGGVLATTGNSVDKILCFVDRHITEIEKLDEAEKTREQLRKVDKLISRIDRHIKRLSNLDTNNLERRSSLIGNYDSISSMLNNFQDVYRKHYGKVLDEVIGNFSKQFGERLRKARYLKEMSQVEVAKEVGFIQNTISRYERGEREPPLYLVYRFAKLYGVTIDYLLGFKDSPFND